MKYSRLHFSLLSLLFAVFAIAAISLHPQSASAAPSYTYSPNPNDVAIQGPNASINAPIAHFKITSSTGGNVKLTLLDACVDITGGNPGLRATISGQTKDTNNDCVGNNLVFGSVAPGTLVVTKINGQGHQAFSVRVDNLTNGQDVFASHIDNPRAGSASYVNDGDVAGFTVWMSSNVNIRFTMPCNYDRSTVFIKWKDADLGQYNQPGRPTLQIQEFNANGTPNGQPWLLSNIGSNGDTRSFGAAYAPGFHYELQWRNFSGTNAIQMVMPFSNNPDQDCGGSPNPPAPPPPPPTASNPACNRYDHAMGDHSWYRFTAYYQNQNFIGSGPAPGTIQATMGGWASYTTPAPYQSPPQQNATGSNVNFGFNYPAPPPSADVRLVYIERWHHLTNGTWEYTRGTDFTSGCADTTTWVLDPILSAVSSQHVEWGGAVLFNHSITNQGPGTASGFIRYRIFNYDPNNPSSPELMPPNPGIGSQVFSGTTIGPGAVYSIPISEQPGYTLNVPNDVALGRKYCQVYAVQPRASYDGSRALSSVACTYVVGGKTGASTSSPQQYVEPGDQATFNGGLVTSQFFAHDTWTGYATSCSYALVLRNAAGTLETPIAGQSGGCDRFISGPGSQSVVNPTYTVPSGTALGSQICLEITIGSSNPNFISGPTTAVACVSVVGKPYFKVLGNDVSVGCAGQNSSIIGWNKGGGWGFAGAGGQYAVFAQNEITYFTSGQSLPTTGAYGNAPTKLSFANVDTDVTNGDYGGSFGGSSCEGDYFAGKPTSALAWQDIADANVKAADPDTADPTFYSPLSLTSLHGQINKSNSTKLYVDGDVYIDGDITGEAGATQVSEIPSLTLYVKGNIYISGSVHRLYGTYIAQQNGASGGQIYTCASLSGSTPRGYTITDIAGNNSLYNTCNGGGQPLVVEGSFTAHKVNLSRTFGSVSRDTSGLVPGGSGYANAGEVFLYNPLLWLRNTMTLNSSNSSGVEHYDAITSLPPVL